jgi:hypothetical protein
MTTHARTGLGDLLVGSGAETVLPQADVALLLLHDTEARLAPPAVAPATR